MCVAFTQSFTLQACLTRRVSKTDTIDQTMEAAKKQDMSLVLNLLEQLQKMVEKTKFGTNHKDSADVAVP